MINTYQKEFEEIQLFFKRNQSEAIVLTSAAFFITLYEYYPVWNRWVSSLVYFAVLPVLVIVLLLRKNPLDFGLRLGNPRIWGFYVVVTCAVGLPILYLASRGAAFQSYYGVADFNLLNYSLENIVYFFAFELMFRGFLLFGLKDRLGEGSILVQMIPFVFIHFGKPGLETISTILTGVYFGYVAYRGNSYWPAFLIHIFINLSFVFFVNLIK